MNSPEKHLHSYLNRPNRSFSRRFALRLSGGLLSIAALNVVGCSSGENQAPSATQPGGANGRPSPSPEASATASPNPSASPSEEASPSASPADTETVAPEPEGSRGLKSIDQMEVTETQKAEIREMLELIGADAEIIGPNFVVAIEGALKTREECPDPGVTGADVMVACPSLTSVRYNLEKFPNSADLLAQSIKTGKVFASRVQAGLTPTEADFTSESETFAFKRRARDLKTGQVGIFDADISAPVVLIFSAQRNNETTRASTSLSSESIQNGSVAGEKVYAFTNGIGETDAVNNYREHHIAATQLGAALSYWSFPKALDYQGNDYISIPTDKNITAAAVAMNKTLVPDRTPGDYDSIFRIEGVFREPGIPR